jgi:hypothetical protein
MINHVDLVDTSRELRTVVQHVIDDVELFRKMPPRPVPAHARQAENSASQTVKETRERPLCKRLTDGSFCQSPRALLMRLTKP